MKKAEDPVKKLILKNAMIIAALIAEFNEQPDPRIDYADPRITKARKTLKKAYFDLLYLTHAQPLENPGKVYAVRQLPMFNDKC